MEKVRLHCHGRCEQVLVTAALGYAAVYASWTAFHWGGDRRVVSDLASWFVVAVATLLAGRRARAATGRTRTAWTFIALGTASWLVGEVAWFVVDIVLGQDPFPSVADAFYLAFYPLVFAGIVAIPVQEVRRRDRLTLVLDSTIVAVTAALVVWYVAIEPQLSSAYESEFSHALALAYPVGDLVLLFGLVRIVSRRPSRGSITSLRVLGLGVGCMVLADLAFARLDLAGTYTDGTLPDALWVFAFVLFALAAYLAHDQTEDPSNYQPQTRRVSVLPFVAVSVGLGLLLYRAADPSSGSLAPLSVGMVLLMVLAVARQLVLQRDVEHLVVELEYLAGTDTLTGLPNRRAFFGQATQLVVEAGRGPCTVIISDLDSFKEINDVHGHTVGDAVLRSVGRCCRNALVTTPGGAVGRIGGDEFAFALPGRDRVQAEHFCAGLAAALESDVTATTSRGAPIRPEVTFGIAVGDGSTDIDELLLAADVDLYRAKAQRHNDRELGWTSAMGGPRNGHLADE